MTRNVRRVATALAPAGLLVVLALSAAPARAQVVKPFKITGEGAGPLDLPLPGHDPRPH